MEGAKEVMLAETDWSWEESLGMLREDVVAIADLLRGEETRKMVALIEVRSTSNAVGNDADGIWYDSEMSRNPSRRLLN